MPRNTDPARQFLERLHDRCFPDECFFEGDTLVCRSTVKTYPDTAFPGIWIIETRILGDSQEHYIHVLEHELPYCKDTVLAFLCGNIPAPGVIDWATIPSPSDLCSRSRGALWIRDRVRDARHGEAQ